MEEPEEPNEADVEETETRTCPSCGEVSASDAKFCEACGQDLLAEPMPECVACGELAVGPEGYCELCGHKQPAERDHKEFEVGSVVAITNRGKRHRHNEDAVAIGEAGKVAVLVVCDGVSSTAGSAEASLRAAKAARDLLLEKVDASSTEEHVAAALEEAAAVAQLEASAVEATTEEHAAPHTGDGPPSCTFVAVTAQRIGRPSAPQVSTSTSQAPTLEGKSESEVVEEVRLSTAWLGDSRAYWLAEEPLQLTVDHEVDGSLSRWLGADSADVVPEISQTHVRGDGTLIVCSDGLWRYAGSASEMKAKVDGFVSEGAGGLTLASSLVDFANAEGGHDNISVAVWSSFNNTTEHEDDNV